MPVALALALAAAIPAAAAPIPPPALAEAPQATSEERFLTKRDIANRMTVATEIDDRGPYPFAIDTAAERSVVSDRLAAALSLPAGAPIRMHAITGLDTVASVRVARLALGKSVRRDFQAPVLDERALGASGLLGLDALAGKRVILDFRARHMTVGASGPVPNSQLSDPNTIVVTARSRFGQLILTDVSLDGRKIYAIIDTGAENTIGNAAFARLLVRHGWTMRRSATLIGVTGRTAPAELASVPHITIAGMEIRDMPVALADVHTFALFKVDKVPALLIGMDVLRAFDRVAIDFGRRQIQFRIPLGRIEDDATQLARETRREGVSTCGSSCPAPPAG